MGFQPLYKKLPLTPSDDFSNEPKKITTKLLCRTTVFLAISLFVIIIGFTTSILIITSHTTHMKGTATLLNPKYCGQNSTQARERGCQFDWLLTAWLPPSCPNYGDGAFQQYLSDHQIQFWSSFDDSPSGQPIPYSELPDRQGGFWLEPEWHAAHCAFMIQRRTIIVDRGERLEKQLKDFEHFEHCVKFLLAVSWGEKADLADTDNFSLNEGKVGLGKGIVKFSSC